MRIARKKITSGGVSKLSGLDGIDDPTVASPGESANEVRRFLFPSLSKDPMEGPSNACILECPSSSSSLGPTAARASGGGCRWTSPATDGSERLQQHPFHQAGIVDLVKTLLQAYFQRPTSSVPSSSRVVVDVVEAYRCIDVLEDRSTGVPIIDVLIYWCSLSNLLTSDPKINTFCWLDRRAKFCFASSSSRCGTSCCEAFGKLTKSTAKLTSR